MIYWQKADYLDEPIHGRKPSQWFREFAMAFKGASSLCGHVD